MVAQKFSKLLARVRISYPARKDIMGTNFGMGVMIQMLFGNGGTREALESSVGKVITKVSLVDDKLLLELETGDILVLSDSGQSCCESRYLTTDDDLSYYSTAILLDVSVEDGPTTEVGYGDTHDIQFLHVKTSLGSFTVETHNEHNGYYGGFYVCAVLEKNND